ncbi:MAG TPA: TylF/MycF/NovP-related O-methyltransferase [Cyclobacteriaceae bacterium]|nr:TylF/MycF/NovP-related O-methyltransferase [Cyclobacteriaceae bacterium]
MAKVLLKKIARLSGVDLKRYNKAIDTYKALFGRYKDLTMISGETFIANLELANRFVGIDGDLVECGVWRGGMIAALAETLGRGRRVHLFDSFEGLPPAKDIDGHAALEWQRNTGADNYYDNCTAEESFARNAMKRSGHEDFRIYKGWFEQTVGSFDGRQIAILRLDGDWYDSTMVCLTHLFPRVAKGGIVILDDYYQWDGCSRAVHDYLSRERSASRLLQWSNQVAYIEKKD